MPAFVAWIGAVLVDAAGSWVVQALIALGIGIVTYEGVDTSMNWLKTQALNAAFSLGPQVVGVLSVLKVGQCINIVLSAIAVRFSIKGLASGKFKSFVKK